MNLVHLIELLFLVTILIVIGLPLFGKLPRNILFAPIDPANEEFKHLLVRKEEVLLAIKDLEFDWKTDKVSEADYSEMKHKLEGEAMTILERLDQLKAEGKKRKKK